MSELKPCPCGGAAMVFECDFIGCCSYQEQGYVECTKCSMRATDEEDWNNRATPELPEGYREDHRYWWECLVGPDGRTIAKDKGGGFNLSGGHASPKDAQALAIWLQRRAR